MMSRSRCELARATDLKPPFQYQAVFDTTAKVDFAFNIFARGKTDRERLPRLQRHEKFDRAYDGKLTVLTPLGQSCEDLIKDYYSWHDRLAGEMPGQAGMISGDRAANLKVHVGSSLLAWKVATWRGSAPIVEASTGRLVSQVAVNRSGQNVHRPAQAPTPEFHRVVSTKVASMSIPFHHPV